MQIGSTNWKILAKREQLLFPFCKTAPTNISITPHSLFLLYHFSLLLFPIKKKLRCFLTLGSTSWVNTVYYSQAYDTRNSLIDHRRPNLMSWLVHECVTRCVTLLSFDMDNSDGKASLKWQKSPETTTDTQGMSRFYWFYV